MGRLTLPTRLALWSRSSNPRAREIVLEVLQKSYPTPIHTRDLFQRIRNEYPNEKLQFPSPDLPLVQVSRTTPPSEAEAGPSAIPYPDHPVRSMRYLKDIIMGDLVHRKLAQKVHAMREPTAEELEQKKSKDKGKKAKNLNKTLVTINAKGMVDEWGWTLRTPEEVEKAKQEDERIKKALEGQQLLDKKKVQKDLRARFIEQWGHLNTRRQRNRVEKLEREEKKATQLEKIREAGRKEAQLATA